MLKDGGEGAVERELLASQICRCFEASQLPQYYEMFQARLKLLRSYGA